MSIIRLAISLVLGFLVAVGLFMFMQILIEPDNERPEDPEDAPAIEITRADRNEDLNVRDRDLQRPQQQDRPPPPPPPAPQQTTRPNIGGSSIGLPRAQVDIGNLSGAVVLDRDPQPIVRIPPQYPRRAAERGQEGYVVVEFTITTDGSVANPVVIESSSSIFEREALRAVAGWRYNPQIVNGEPIDRAGVRVTIDFRLEDTR